MIVGTGILAVEVAPLLEALKRSPSDLAIAAGVVIQEWEPVVRAFELLRHAQKRYPSRLWSLALRADKGPYFVLVASTADGRQAIGRASLDRLASMDAELSIQPKEPAAKARVLKSLAEAEYGCAFEFLRLAQDSYPDRLWSLRLRKGGQIDLVGSSKIGRWWESPGDALIPEEAREGTLAAIDSCLGRLEAEHA